MYNYMENIFDSENKRKYIWYRQRLENTLQDWVKQIEEYKPKHK